MNDEELGRRFTSAVMYFTTVLFLIWLAIFVSRDLLPLILN